MKLTSLGVLLIVPFFMIRTCFGGIPECEDGKDFQTEMAHILGVSEIEGDDQRTSIFNGFILKLFHNSQNGNDKDESKIFSSEGGQSVDNEAIKSSENSRTYTHSKIHFDSDLTASVLRDIMPLNAPNKRVVLALDAEPSYRHAVIMLAIVKNAYSHVDVSMHLSHSHIMETLKTVNPQIVLVSKMAYQNHERIFKHFQKNESVTNTPLILSVDEKVEGLKYLFSSMDDKENEFSSTSSTNTNDITTKLSPSNYPLNNEAVISFTSGSTGVPKIVVHSICNILRDATREISLPSKSVFQAGGMQGLIGYMRLLYCSAYGGMYIPVFFDDQLQVYDEAIHDKIMEIKVEELLLESNVTTISSTPMQIDLIAEIINELNEEIADEEPAKSQYSLDTVEIIMTYGVKMSSLTFNNIIKTFPFSKIINAYGSIEVLSVASNENVLEGKEALTINPNIQVSLSFHQQGEEEGGRILVKSDRLMLGYLDPSGNTYQLPLDEDGWFSMGDYAKLDENGDMILLGRSRPSLNFDGDELDPTRIARAWEGFLKSKTDITYKEELIVVRDLQHSVFGHAAVVFIRLEKTSCDKKADDQSSSFMFSKSILDTLHQVILDTSKSFHQQNADELSNAFWAASILCFVDDFPRVGALGKVNYLELERMYMEEIKVELFLKGNQMALEYDGSFHGDNEMHILLTSLKWDGSRYDVMDWVELPKM